MSAFIAHQLMDVLVLERPLQRQAEGALRRFELEFGNSNSTDAGNVKIMAANKIDNRKLRFFGLIVGADNPHYRPGAGIVLRSVAA
jgi:hypothetical protein